MASTPLVLYGPKGNIVYWGANLLYESAQESAAHKAYPRVDRDFRQNVSALGFRQLMSAGRALYANCPQLANAVNKIAELAIGDAFLPQYYGRNREWGKRAEDLLIEWHKILDVRGGVYDWATDLKLWLKSILRDGDVGVLLSQSPGGYPLIQTIPSHRIGGQLWQNGVVVGGPWDGYEIYNGVIQDEYGRAVALRITDALGLEYRDVSLCITADSDGRILANRDAILLYDPDWADQSRGLSKISAGINDWSDLRQVKDYLKMALRKEASFAVVEYNETGEADAATDFTRTGPDGNPFAAALYQEKVEGGLSQIYRANSGSKIEFPAGERPSERSQQFWDRIQRDAFQALGWPMEFYDSAGKGGAAIRLLMELAQPTVEAAQAIAKKIAVAVDSWRVGKAIKAGELPDDPDWWMVDHQTPEQMTADRGYSAAIDREDYTLGFSSLKDVAARRGKWREDLFQERQDEAQEYLDRAAQIVANHNAAHPEAPIDLTAALALMRQPGQQPTPARGNQPQPLTQDTKEEDEA